jgi:hypothetical protein
LQVVVAIRTVTVPAGVVVAVAVPVQLSGATRMYPRVKPQTPANVGHRMSGRRRHGKQTSMASPVNRKGAPMLIRPTMPNRTRPTASAV